MLDFILHTEKDDAINILKADHQRVDALFREFEQTTAPRAKKKIVAQVLDELRIHTVLEEELFYASVRPRMKKDLMNEANEEHHVAKLLIAELAVMKGDEEHYDAKVKVLSENIRHHVKEEEGEMFPKVRSLKIDMRALGEKLLTRKEELLTKGIPASAEEKLLASVGAAKIDSPARAVVPRNHKAKAAPSTKKPGLKSKASAIARTSGKSKTAKPKKPVNRSAANRSSKTPSRNVK